jgi:hypothetical protein
MMQAINNRLRPVMRFSFELIILFIMLLSLDMFYSIKLVYGSVLG